MCFHQNAAIFECHNHTHFFKLIVFSNAFVAAQFLAFFKAKKTFQL